MASNKIAYAQGVYDILREKDLLELDKHIQLSKSNGVKYFGVGIYDANLCEHLGISTPFKSLEDRIAIMEHIRGIDFVFPISSLHPDIMKNSVKNAFSDFKNKPKDNAQSNKLYELGYAPGTYDLFHAGHLENLTTASSYCKRLIVGVKSDELVYEHKHRKPVVSAEERMEILRHFKFVYDVYKYHTRDLHVANDWLQSKYNHTIDAIFLGSDLEKDFADVKDLNIHFTERPPELMKERSSSNYYNKLRLSKDPQSRYTCTCIATQLGNIPNITIDDESLDYDEH